MARFYARFDHATESALEVTDSSNSYDKRVIAASSASGATFRDALISTRSALSAQMISQLDYANSIGVNGPIIPSDVLHYSAPNLTFDNVYKTTTIPGVQWPSDPRVRPTGSIVSTNGNLTASSPVDSGTILYTYYTDATTAVNNAIAAIKKTDNTTSDGPNVGRVSNYPTRTTYSVWHNHALDYFAWDDYTPGLAGYYFVGAVPTQKNSGVVIGVDPATYKRGVLVPDSAAYISKVYSGDTDHGVYLSFRWNITSAAVSDYVIDSWGATDSSPSYQYSNDRNAHVVFTADLKRIDTTTNITTSVVTNSTLNTCVDYSNTGLSDNSDASSTYCSNNRQDWLIPLSYFSGYTTDQYKYYVHWTVTFYDGRMYSESPQTLSSSTPLSKDSTYFYVNTYFSRQLGVSGTNPTGNCGSFSTSTYYTKVPSTTALTTADMIYTANYPSITVPVANYYIDNSLGKWYNWDGSAIYPVGNC